MSDHERSFCSTFHRAIELVGRRWAGAIIQTLAQGPTRFTAIRATVQNVTPRMLAERLRELEAEGVVERRVIPGRPPGVEYLLTPMGEELAAALKPLSAWAHRWMEQGERVSG